MGRVFRPWSKHPVTGKPYQSPNWYVEWHGADGRTRRKSIGAKHEAEEFLANVQARERRVRHGLEPDPAANPDRLKPLTELLRLYLEVLDSRNTDAVYRSNVKAYLDRILSACGWLTWRDITADSLIKFLGRRRESHKVSPATLNAYLRTAKGFTNWLADRIGLPNPLKRLKPFAEEVDRRRSRRILTDEELAKLLTATEKGRRWGKQVLGGADRAMLYRVAAYTGIRAGELATLTPASFRLDASPPVVVVEAKHAKGKRVEPVPIPAGLVEVIRSWLKKKPAGKPVWPGRWADHRRQRNWLATDLKRAEVQPLDSQGRHVTFHSLKRRYVTRLIEAGAKIHEVRRLARHVDVKTTLNYYADANLADLGRLADRLA